MIEEDGGAQQQFREMDILKCVFATEYDTKIVYLGPIHTESPVLGQ